MSVVERRSQSDSSRGTCLQISVGCSEDNDLLLAVSQRKLIKHYRFHVTILTHNHYKVKLNENKK